MKAIAFFASLIVGILMAVPVPADTPAWSVIWFPWNATYSSWDWTGGTPSITVQSVNNDTFPTSVKKWSLGVCSARNPSTKTLVPLPNPYSIDGHGKRVLDLERWTPGSVGFPISQLDALGEETFLCAIIGDGQRYSNVSRLTISHPYQHTPPPGVQVFALPFIDHDIHRIAVRLVPPASPDDAIYAMDLAYPAVSINGSWSRPSTLAWAAPNTQLQAGTTYVWVVDLDHYDPPISPFKKADVQVKIIENSDKAWRTLQPAGAGQDRSAVIKKWLDDQQGPSSLVCTLTATETDAINFDLAFDLK
jgi:hypothetical protein